MSTKPIEAAVARLVRVLKSDKDIRRGIRVDKRIANDGNVILDDDLGLIRMIENIDAARADLAANTISLIDKLTNLGQPITRDLFSSANGTLLTNHTGLDGATWAKSAGTGNFTIHNGRIYGSEIGVLYSSGIPESADYHVGAQFTYFNDTADNGIGIRVQPGANTGYFLYFNFGAFRLYRMVSGAITNLGSVTYASSALPVVAGITATGSTIQIIIDGAVRLTVTDTVITAKGRPGLRSSTITTTTGVHLDKFYAARVPLATTAQVSNEIGVVNNTIDTEIANEADARQASDAQLDVLKRNLADAIPQGDVTNLVSNLANKLEPGTAQSNVNGLVTALANKLEPGTPQSNISGLVTKLNDITTDVTNRATTTTVQDLTRSRYKASDQTFTGTSAATCDVYFGIDPYQTWDVTIKIPHATSATDGAFSGARFGVTIPPNVVILSGALSGVPSSSSGIFNERITFNGGLSTVWLTKYITSLGYATIDFVVRSLAGSGLVELIVAVADDGDALTVNANTSIIAKRVYV